MPLRALACGVFAVALLGLGVVAVTTGDFAYVFQPVPAWVPARSALAYASGVLLVACSAGLLWPRVLERSALVLSIYCGASMLLLHVPRIVQEPWKEEEWFGLGEVATMLAGALLLFRASAHRGRAAQALFALALPTFGLSHFVYAKTTAGMVPSFLPWHLGWAYLTGAAHIAAGLAILFGLLPRLAATLEGLMVVVFVFSVNLPELIRAPRERWQWTELFVALAIAGAAFLVARSYDDDSWRVEA